MIKVILKENIAGVGKTGEVKQVKDGFARNYLLPKNLALPATDNNLRKIEADAKKRQAQEYGEKKKAEELAERLGRLSVTVALEVNEEGKPYGSLSAADVVRAVGAEGIELDKKHILLEAPVRELGIYDIDVRLHPEVSCKIKVWVVKK